MRPRECKGCGCRLDGEPSTRGLCDFCDSFDYRSPDGLRPIPADEFEDFLEFSDDGRRGSDHQYHGDGYDG